MHALRHSDSGRPSSAGFRKDDDASSYRESNNSSHLRDQILELGSRMRCLETRLLEEHNPPSSSPARDYNNNHHDGSDEAQLSPVRRCRRHQGFPRGERSAMPTSSLAAGTTPTAAMEFAHENGGDARGSGYKRGSQDDLVYRSRERHNRAGNLSKQSWPPGTASSSTAAVGRGSVPMHALSDSHSNSSSSGSSAPSLVFAARELTTVSPHPRGWEGGHDSAARAASGGRINSRGGGMGRGRRRVGRRKSSGSGKNRNGNPPGIVLI